MDADIHIPEDGASGVPLVLLAGTPAVANALADVLLEQHLIFARRGCTLEMVGPREASFVVEVLRHMLPPEVRKQVHVTGSGPSGYSRQVSLDAWWRQAVTGWFEEALERNRFSTLFQPVVDTASNRVFAHECLIHLQDTRSYCGGEIVEAARLCQKVRRFDEMARGLAIRSATERGGPGQFFVNVLPEAIRNPQVCLESTFAGVREAGVSPGRVIFEMVEPGEADLRQLRVAAALIRAQGCRFGLDDVGPGGAGLITKLKPDYVKLTPGLLADIESPASAEAIHRLVRTGGEHGAAVIAKNVENAVTMEFLWLLGVELMQGHFFGRPSPMPAGSATDLLSLASALEPTSVLVPARWN